MGFAIAMVCVLALMVLSALADTDKADLAGRTYFGFFSSVGQAAFGTATWVKLDEPVLGGLMIGLSAISFALTVASALAHRKDETR